MTPSSWTLRIAIATMKHQHKNTHHTTLAFSQCFHTNDWSPPGTSVLLFLYSLPMPGQALFLPGLGLPTLCNPSTLFIITRS